MLGSGSKPGDLYLHPIGLSQSRAAPTDSEGLLGRVSQHVETQAEFGGALRSDLPRDVLPPCSSAAATQGPLSQGHCPGKGRASSGRWKVMFPACFFQMETLLRGLVAGQ